jgi:hypothetical protein
VGQDAFLRDGWLPSPVAKDRKADSGESAAGCQLSLTNPPHTYR